MRLELLTLLGVSLTNHKRSDPHDRRQPVMRILQRRRYDRGMDGKRPTEREFEEAVRRGVAWTRDRREAEERIAGLARRDPEFIARGLILLAQREHGRLRRELRERFGFTAVWGREGLVCRFDGPKRLPKTREQAARWTDLLVHLIELIRQSKLILQMLNTVAGAYGGPVPEEARALRELARRP